MHPTVFLCFSIKAANITPRKINIKLLVLYEIIKKKFK